MNAVSIVMKVQYENRSVLFGGDAVGKLDDDQPVATEAFLLDSAKSQLDVDVVIAPHHGADNGSSDEFIDATSPEFVIFSAGHDHEHPKAATAARYIAAGVDANNMLRTDLGDDEGGDEWDHGSVPNLSDPIRDNDIVITITEDGVLTVDYVDN